MGFGTENTTGVNGNTNEFKVDNIEHTLVYVIKTAFRKKLRERKLYYLLSNTPYTLVW